MACLEQSNTTRELQHFSQSSDPGSSQADPKQRSNRCLAANPRQRLAVQAPFGYGLLFRVPLCGVKSRSSPTTHFLRGFRNPCPIKPSHELLDPLHCFRGIAISVWAAFLGDTAASCVCSFWLPSETQSSLKCEQSSRDCKSAQVDRANDFWPDRSNQ